MQSFRTKGHSKSTFVERGREGVIEKANENELSFRREEEEGESDSNNEGSTKIQLIVICGKERVFCCSFRTTAV